MSIPGTCAALLASRIFTQRRHLMLTATQAVFPLKTLTRKVHRKLDHWLEFIIIKLSFYSWFCLNLINSKPQDSRKKVDLKKLPNIDKNPQKRMIARCLELRSDKAHASSFQLEGPWFIHLPRTCGTPNRQRTQYRRKSHYAVLLYHFFFFFFFKAFLSQGQIC